MDTTHNETQVQQPITLERGLSILNLDITILVDLRNHLQIAFPSLDPVGLGLVMLRCLLFTCLARKILVRKLSLGMNLLANFMKKPFRPPLDL